MPTAAMRARRDKSEDDALSDCDAGTGIDVPEGVAGDVANGIERLDRRTICSQDAAIFVHGETTVSCSWAGELAATLSSTRALEA